MATYSAWKWQRVIVPDATSPASEQCAVLDAAMFAGAEPGLRDVRLVQDGRELAYATDISLDERGEELRSTSEDRALYETALIVPARPSEWPGPVSSGDEASRSAHPPGWFYGRALLPARVPVERIRLESPVAGAEYISVRAAETGRLADAETLEATLTRERPALAFTVGANLQQAADVRLGVHGDALAVSAFVLEMRRREICYQPLSRSPIMLLFGNPNAPPVHYEFSTKFMPKTSPRLSTLGPVQQNPAFQVPVGSTASGRRFKLILAMFACALALVLTLGLLRPRKRPR